MAVSPLASTAFTSAPSSKASCAASSTSGSVPDSSRGHQRRAVIGIPQQRIGAQLDQQPHERGVRSSSGHQERRRAELAVLTRPALAILQPRVQVRAMLHKLFDELEAAQISGPNWRWITVVAIAAIRFANP